MFKCLDIQILAIMLDTQILAIMLQLATIIFTVTCYTGLYPRNNRLYRLYHTAYDICTTKVPNNTFLRTYTCY